MAEIAHVGGDRTVHVLSIGVSPSAIGARLRAFLFAGDRVPWLKS